MYDPTIGRWISQDPLGFEAGDSNLYRYVENRTLSKTDPSGLVDFDPPAAAELAPSGVTVNSSDLTKHGTQIAENRLRYYEKVGWIDWEHTEPTLPQEIIRKIKAEQSVSVPASNQRIINCKRRLFDWQNQDDGFLIVIQEASGGQPLQSVINPTRRYYVKKGLDEESQLETALGIFKDYHNEFENNQENLATIQWWLTLGISTPSTSGNSQEDRVSDLIAFARAVNPDYDTRAKMEGILGRRLSQQASLDLLYSLGGDLGLPANKNRTWLPVDHNGLLGLPAMAFPLRELKSVETAPEGSTWFSVVSSIF